MWQLLSTVFAIAIPVAMVGTDVASEAAFARPYVAAAGMAQAAFDCGFRGRGWWLTLDRALELSATRNGRIQLPTAWRDEIFQQARERYSPENCEALLRNGVLDRLDYLEQQALQR